VIADPVIADAIHDRLKHAALVLNITGGELSRCQGTKTCQPEKGRLRIVVFGSASDPIRWS
jgi:hypothetical protein